MPVKNTDFESSILNLHILLPIEIKIQLEKCLKEDRIGVRELCTLFLTRYVQRDSRALDIVEELIGRFNKYPANDYGKVWRYNTRVEEAEKLQKRRKLKLIENENDIYSDNGHQD